MRTVLYDLPPRVRAFCLEDGDGEQTVVLNSRLSWENNKKSLEHELTHTDDFIPGTDVKILEFIRHKND